MKPELLLPGGNVEKIDYAIKCIVEIVDNLRKLSPLYFE